jgi:hypothetical protein
MDTSLVVIGIVVVAVLVRAVVVLRYARANQGILQRLLNL